MVRSFSVLTLQGFELPSLHAVRLLPHGSCGEQFLVARTHPSSCSRVRCFRAGGKSREYKPACCQEGTNELCTLTSQALQRPPGTSLSATCKLLVSRALSFPFALAFSFAFVQLAIFRRVAGNAHRRSILCPCPCQRRQHPSKRSTHCWSLTQLLTHLGRRLGRTGETLTCSGAPLGTPRSLGLLPIGPRVWCVWWCVWCVVCGVWCGVCGTSH